MESSEITESKGETRVDPEREADIRLEELLQDPAYAFLRERTEHMERIDNAETAVEALAIAEEIIIQRMERTFTFTKLKDLPGYEIENPNLRGLLKTVCMIKKHQEGIGEGGDAFVVISKNEIRELPPEVCYKFAKREETPRGRNPMSYEAVLQGEFFNVTKEFPDSLIGIPEPYYVTEMGSDKILAMEKLPARSVDDILRGKGSLPTWFDIDRFCDELQTMFNELHARGLYHRDMHPGNIMIRQSPEEPEDGKWGYIIDFGLSGHGNESMDPYRKEAAGKVFTYNKDDGIVTYLRRSLLDYQLRQRGI